MKQVLELVVIAVLLSACGNTSKDQSLQPEREIKPVVITEEDLKDAALKGKESEDYFKERRRLNPDFDPSDYEGSTDVRKEFTKEEQEEHKRILAHYEKARREIDRQSSLAQHHKSSLRTGLNGAYGKLMGDLAILRHAHLQDEEGITIHHKYASLSGIRVYVDGLGLSVANDLSDLNRHRTNHRSEGYVKLNDTTSWLGSVGYFGDIRKGYVMSYSTGILHKLSDTVNIAATMGERVYQLNTPGLTNAQSFSTLNPFSEVSIHWAINPQQRFGVSSVFEKLSSSTEIYLATYYQYDLCGNHLKLDASIGVNLRTSCLEQVRFGFQFAD